MKNRKRAMFFLGLLGIALYVTSVGLSSGVSAALGSLAAMLAVLTLKW